MFLLYLFIIKLLARKDIFEIVLVENIIVMLSVYRRTGSLGKS